MQYLVEYLPLILFFVAYKWKGIFFATAIAIAASLVQIIYMKLRKRPIATMQWIGLAIIVVFGGATLLLQDELFIKWKPTVLYWIIAGLLTIGQLVLRRNWLRRVFQASELSLPDPVWTRLLWIWVAFFVFMGALNLYVAFNFSLDVWVNFKVWGGIGLIFVFVLAQGWYIAKHLPQQEADHP